MGELYRTSVSITFNSPLFWNKKINLLIGNKTGTQLFTLSFLYRYKSLRGVFKRTCNWDNFNLSHWIIPENSLDQYLKNQIKEC